MKIKPILAVLLSALILSACAPAQTAVLPTQTAALPPTAIQTPLPPTATATVTATAAPTQITTITPTSPPHTPLSKEGPWLVNLIDPYRNACCGGAPRDGEIKLINQDGRGYTTIPLEECDNVSEFFLQSGNQANYLAQFNEGLYLFRPAEGIGVRIFREVYGNDCHTYYNGGVHGGLLAGFYQESEEVSPELILFDLPDGGIRERIPLVECGTNNPVCENRPAAWSVMMKQEPLWSPDGRYLAFVALRDAPSSDIFLYDTETGDLQSLTNGPEWVNLIGWSPDGSQIIFGEIDSYEGGFFSPWSFDDPTKAVWSLSVSTQATKFLYAPEGYRDQHRIFLWLDEQHFLAYAGGLGGIDGAENLRYVDTQNGTDRILFNGDYIVDVIYDPVHEVFMIYELGTLEYYPGLYLVSMKDGNIRYLVEEGPPYITYIARWDEETGLFLSEDPCEEGSERILAADYLGNTQCIPGPTPTPAPVEIPQYPSPNGEWSASIQVGLWLENGNEPAVQISDESPKKVVWCPDSSCLFYSVFHQDRTWTIYHVSLPDLTITRVAGGIQILGEFQWLGGE